MEKQISITIADTGFICRKGLVSLLSERPYFKVLGEVETFKKLMDLSLIAKTQVLITDLSKAEFSFGNIALFLKKHPSIRVLNISANSDKRFFKTALETGVLGHLLKDCGEEEILEAIQKVFLGEKFVCGQILDAAVNEAKESIDFSHIASCDGVSVTDRETEIICLVAEGLSNKQIADKLFLSPHTITTHRKNIMAKLKVNNSAGLVLYAIKNNLLSPNKFLFSSQS